MRRDGCSHTVRPRQHLGKIGATSRPSTANKPSLFTPRHWRLDGLLLVLDPARTHLNLEVDGKGHDPSGDEERTTALAMATVRIPWYELLNGPSLTERLRAMGFCLPRTR